ncbi:MAG: right-handed parallel beta-helix repeat-containing protein [Pirellulales bacterium]
MSRTRPRRSRNLFAPARRLRIESLEARQLLTVTVNSDLDYAQVASPMFAGETGQFDDTTPIITLRSAIEAVNAGLDDEIQFSTSLVIEPGASLPTVTHDGVTIDGGSVVTLDGTTAGGAGLVINASECIIVGLTIRDFSGYGILIASTSSTVANDNRVENNVLTANGVGIAIDDTASADLDHLFFADFELDPGETDNASGATGNQLLGNTITSNTTLGVLIAHASLNLVDGNTISGTTAGPGVEIQGLGDALIEHELVNGSLKEKITIDNDATRNEITANVIGDNHGDGVLVNGGSHNFIGLPGQGNVISGNVGNGTTTGNGIVITGAATLGAGTSSEPESFAPLSSGSAAEKSFAELAQTWTLQTYDPQEFQSAGLPPIVYNVQWVGDLVSGVPILNGIQGNFIGTDAAGRVANGNALDGILIDTAARVTLIGDPDLDTLQANPGELTTAANVIGGNRNGITICGAALYEDAIDHAQAEDDTVGGPYYGNHRMDIDGAPATFTMDNQDFQNNATIFELVPTIVAGNAIGAFSDSEGVYAIGNTDDGLLIDHSRAFVYFNTISANGANGIHITGTPQSALIVDDMEATLYSRSYVDSVVSGNKIGTDIMGLILEDGNEDSLGNTGHGVFIENGGQYNIVGPTTQDEVDPYITAQAQRNVIANNGGWGVYVHGMGAYHFEGTPSVNFSDPFAYPEFDDPEEFLYQPYGTNANTIAGNFVGVDSSGSGAAGNGMGGVLIDNAAAYTIVGSIATPLEQQWWGNVISANDGPGIEITGKGTAVSVVGGNLIGLSADGETGLGNASAGVWIHDQPVATNIGGDVFNANLGSRNYIADSNGPGILIENVYDLPRAIVANPPEGQAIGDPKSPLNNLADEEVWLAALNSGTNYYETVIASNWIGLGVEFETGTDPSTGFVTRVGFTPIPLGNHGDGIKIVDSSNTDIGGAHPGWTKNTISANDGHGVHISGDRSFLNFIKQAHIGTDPTGVSAANTYGSFANGGDGVRIDGDAHHNLIQGTGMGRDFFSVQLLPSIENGGNGTVILEALRASFDVAENGVVISNNGGNGVVIDSAQWNQIGGGTYIGTNLGGTAALGNVEDGILITGGSASNQIAPRGARVEQRITYDSGTVTEQGATWGDVITPLIISANGGAGITVEGTDTDNNTVIGAMIGAGFNSGAMIGMGNTGPGVLIRDSASENLLDEVLLGVLHEPEDIEDPPQFATVTLKNVIVANGTTSAPRAGIEIIGADTTGNQVLSSLIGTNELGALDLGNTGDGVLITASASGNLIGEVGGGNTIARNGTASTATYAGVAIKGTATTDNVVAANAIELNHGDGVFINEAFGNQVLANTIDQNASHGVEIVGTAHDNTIGDVGSSDGNTITLSGGNGVYLHGNSLAITGWGIDEFGDLTLELDQLDGVYVGQELTISGFGLLDGDLTPIIITTATVVSINVSTSTIVTDVEVPLDAEGDAAGVVLVDSPKNNTVRGNWIGTDAGESDLGNADNGVLLSAAQFITVAGNHIRDNEHHGVKLDQGAASNVIGGTSASDENEIMHNGAAGGSGWAGVLIEQAAQSNQVQDNTIAENTGDGVRITGAGANTIVGADILDNTGSGVVIGGSGSRLNVVDTATIDGNDANGVLFTDGAEGNAVVGSDILNNKAHGVLITNGAEGNGVGVSINLDGAEGVPIATDPTAANSIRGNEGNQVRMSSANTKFNFVAGYNDIEAVANQDAIVIDGAVANVIGNGGEGQDPEGVYVVGSNTPAYQNGNRIDYGAGDYGVAIYEGSNGAEGNAILGNAFVGDPNNAIFIDGYSGVVPPTIDDVSVTGSGPFDLEVETTVAGASSTNHVRVDYYLVNPSNPLETHVLGSMIFTSSAADTFTVTGVDADDTDLDGWYVTATATYDIQGDDQLRIGSVSSTMDVYEITT